MGMEAGPGPICTRCHDDKWRLSARGWCDNCEAGVTVAVEYLDHLASTSTNQTLLRAVREVREALRRPVAPAQSGDVLDGLWWRA